MLNLFNNLVLAEKTVIITTDMYLTEDIIKQLLELNGYHGFTRIYLSKNGLSKHNGKLFDAIVKDFSSFCNPDEIVHIGDNMDSDFLIPQKYGIKSIFLDKPLNLFKKSAIGSKFVPTSNGDRVLIGMIANHIFDNPFVQFTTITVEQFS